LFADQHDLGSLRAFAEYGLRRVLPEMTGAAVSGRFAQGVDIVGGCCVLRFTDGSGRFCDLCGSVAALAIVASVAGSAPAVRGLIIEASGRFRQYLFLGHLGLHGLHLQPGRMKMPAQ
jgi:hypothetical protein